MTVLFLLEDIVTDDILPIVISLGCEGQDWVKLGKELLGWPDREVRDLFTDPNGREMRNTERVERVITIWKERDGNRATIGVLQAASYKLGKGGEFEILLDKKFGVV